MRVFLDVAKTVYISIIVDYRVSRRSLMFTQVVVKLSSPTVNRNLNSHIRDAKLVGALADGLLGKGTDQLDGFGLKLLRVTQPCLLRHVDSFSGGFAPKLSGVHQTGSSPNPHVDPSHAA